MQSGVVACCVLVSWLAGSQIARSVEEELAPQRVEEAVVALPTTAERTAEPELAQGPRPGLLSLLTLGTAVVGAIATPAGQCRSDACLAASIIDRTARLDAVRRAALGHTRRDGDRLAPN